MNDLVKRLHDRQPIKLSRLKEGISSLRAQYDLGYVHVLFIKTGTELTIELDKKNSSALPDDQFHGPLHFEGKVTLNYDKVRVMVDVQPTDLTGEGTVSHVSDDEYEAIAS